MGTDVDFRIVNIKRIEKMNAYNEAITYLKDKLGVVEYTMFISLNTKYSKRNTKIDFRYDDSKIIKNSLEHEIHLLLAQYHLGIAAKKELFNLMENLKEELKEELILSNIELELKLGCCRVYCADCGTVLTTDEGHKHKYKSCPTEKACKELEKFKR